MDVMTPSARSEIRALRMLNILPPALLTPIKRRRIHKIKRVETVDPIKPRVNMARLRREQRAMIDMYI